MKMVLLSWLLGTAHAGNEADEAEVNFQLGRQAFRSGRLNQALSYFMLSNRLSENRNVMYNIGLIYEELGNETAAYRWYFRAWDEEQPEDQVTVRAKANLERLRQRVGIAELVSDPPGAKIYVQRKNLGQVGTTPLDFPLPPGNYVFIFEKPGYELLTLEPRTLEAGKEESVEVALTPIVGTVRISGIEGAMVRLDADGDDVPPRCQTPCNLPVPIGPQIIRVTKEGYRPEAIVVDLERGEERDLEVTPQPITGGLMVRTGLRTASVEVDGIDVGRTPLFLTDVLVGRRTVRVAAPGHLSVTQVVDIVEGQTADLGRVDLKANLTVTAASGFAQDAAEAPASVNVVPEEEIRAFGYQSVLEAVQGLRGVFATNDLSYSAIGVRGFGRTGDYGNRILVNLDGHRMNDNLFGSSYLAEDLLSDLGDVSRVELVRGPGSAVHGSNASFGVVNVVTRDGVTAVGSHATVTANGDGLRARASVGGGEEHRGFWISGSALYGQGRRLEFDAFPGEVTTQDGIFTRTASARAWVGDLTLQANFHERDREVPTAFFGTVFGDDRARTFDRRGFVELRYVAQRRQTRWDLRASYDHYRSIVDLPYAVDDVFQDDLVENGVTLIAQGTQRFGDVLDLSIGASTRQYFAAELRTFEYEDLDEDPVRQGLDEPATTQAYSAFAVADLHPGTTIRLNAGARLDHYQISGRTFTAVNPRVAMVFSPGAEVLKVMAGTAFRAPSPYELDYSDGVTQVASATLVPETTETAELEWTHRFSQVTTSTVTAYTNRVRNLVQPSVLSPEERGAFPALSLADGAFRLTSAEDPVVTLGGEAELRRWWHSGWMVAGQVSYQRTRENRLFAVQGEPRSEQPRRLTNSPVWMGSFLGSVPISNSIQWSNKLRIESGRRTSAGETTDGAVLLDLTVVGTVDRFKLRYGVGIRNLLGYQVGHPGGPDLVLDQVPQRGRSFFASVHVGL